MTGGAPTASPTQQRWRVRLIATLILAAAPVAVLAPKGTVVLVALGATIMLLTAPWRRTLVALGRLGAARWLLLPLLAWAGASLAWSIEPASAAELWLRYGAVTLAGAVLLTGLWASPTAMTKRWNAVLAVAGPVLLALLLLELATDGVLTRLVRPGEAFHPNMLARGAVLAALIAWPSAAALAARAGSWLATVFLALAFGALLWSPIAAASAAFLFGAVLFGTTLWCGAGAVRALAWLLPLAMLAFAVVFVLGDAGKGIWQAYPDLHYSLRHRLLIWQFVGERIAEHPLLGWGLDASRDLPGAESPYYGPRFGGVLPLHPHNAALQLWVELGLPGLVLAAALFGVVLRARPLQDGGVWPRAAALGAAGTYFAVAHASFGIWQNWWGAAAWLTAVVMAVALARPDARNGEAGTSSG